MGCAKESQNKKLIQRVQNIHLEVELELMEDAGKVSSQETFPAASDEGHLYKTWKLGDFDKVYIELTKDVACLLCHLVLFLSFSGIVYMKVLRERDGIPDLRRAARFLSASVTLPKVDGPARKLLKGGRDLDDILPAAVIQNLKVVQDRYRVIVMDADGSRSTDIARSLRKLGVKASIWNL
ncbi:hypothetical protein D5086_033796 [Populus alba]|uniref:Uncharacterized protein n=1 Tax=Populus alba TaxID=43335 RepID=A0ACC4AHS8_POPAL